MADRSLSVIGGTYWLEDSDSESTGGGGGGGIEEDVGDVATGPVRGGLLLSARGPVGTFWYPPRGA